MRTPDSEGNGPGPARRHRRYESLPGGAANPLERPSDRLERRLDRVLMAVLIASLPLVAWTGGSTAHAHFEHQRRTQVAERHLVATELLADARKDGGSPGTRAGAHALVRWNDQAGVHTAVVPVAAGQQQGTRARVWLDADGKPTSPPATAESVTATGIAAGMAAALGACVIVGGTYKGIRWTFDRRRIQQWEREWQLVEPRWNRRER
ncbi:hypothetical protein ACFCZ1_30180 [Streptomyces sp. NPDC056224]|uniref:Rv1733c family protein n=1 Tax=Streptomyces sp. NPDC056224 TaxID=3345750 RepID=UPI0035DB8DF4